MFKEFSVVVPVHNEERFLFYSLPSIYRLEPDEVILLFDRCTDKSLNVAEKLAKRFEYAYRTRFIELNKPSPEWAFRVAFLRWHGFKEAKNDIILNTDADVILDEKIKTYLPQVGKNNVALISFGRKSYPPAPRLLIARLITNFSLKAFAGTFAFSRRALFETIDENTFRRIVSAEDTYIYLSISKKYKTMFIQTNTIHLREKESAEKQFVRGIAYWEVGHNPLWKATLHSIVYFRPLLLAGYFHARLKDRENTDFFLKRR
jgi:glycosyltransferase involved in cell wall biosynthesis